MFCSILDESICATCRVDEGEPLPDFSQIRCAIITGSPAMVTEHLDWSETLAEWILKAHQNIPLLGVCYGHQLIAYALGGVVDYNPNGREIGTVVASKVIDDPLFYGLDSQFEVQTTHSQSVIRLPGTATLLATTQLDPHHAFKIGNNTYGVQFHPEFSARTIQHYLVTRREEIVSEKLDWLKLYQNTHPVLTGRLVLNNFKKLCSF